MILDRALGLVLGGIDNLNIMLSPFEKFTRPIYPYDERPLSEIEAAFWADIQEHWLFGYDRELYWSMAPNDGGDMAIWHGVYTATCALRKDQDALERALKGCRVLQGAGADSRLVRGANSLDGPLGMDPTRTYYRRVIDGRVYSTLADVSESSIIGHVFGLWMAYRWSDSASAQAVAAEMLRDLAATVAADGDRLLDPDGRPARFGDLRPKITTAPIRIAALTMLYAAAGAANNDANLLSRVDQLEHDHAGALRHPETHFLWIHPWYQDVIAYMAIAVLKDARPDKKIYRKSIEGLWAKNKEEGNSFYTYLLEANDIRTSRADRARDVLKEFPSAKLVGNVIGSEYAADKFKWGWKWAKGGNWLSHQPVKVWIRPPADFVWQRCPYSLDGGTSNRYNSLDFCAAYWLGRRSGMI
jgi:hypothetical protein